MLISFDEIYSILLNNNINITGALHIGAHDCEELSFYNNLKLNNKNIIWIEAMEHKVIENKKRGIENIYSAIISDKDNEIITFNIANNGQSSSMLEFKTHTLEHPDVKFIDSFTSKTITIDTFFITNNLNCNEYNFWNFDIQGAELLALKGGTKSIENVKAIYLEVNEKELYKNCGLITDIDNFLQKYGFIRILTKMTNHGWGDALYIKC